MQNTAAPVFSHFSGQKPHLRGKFFKIENRYVFQFLAGNAHNPCHSPLPDWIADAGELVLGVDMGAPQDSRRGILVINSNSN